MRRRTEAKFSRAFLQEHLLQGAILDNQRDPFLHRLNGICDTVGAGPEKFNDHEFVYVLANEGQEKNESCTLRVRKAIDHPETPHHMRYVGAADFGDRNRVTLMRSYIDIPVTDNIGEYLLDLGFKLDHEFVARGYIFRKGIMKIIVSKIYKVNNKLANPTKLENLEAVSKSHVVDLSILTMRSTHHQPIQQDMRIFSEQLYPYIKLEKLDHHKIDRDYKNSAGSPMSSKAASTTSSSP